MEEAVRTEMRVFAAALPLFLQMLSELMPGALCSLLSWISPVLILAGPLVFFLVALFWLCNESSADSMQVLWLRLSSSWTEQRSLLVLTLPTGTWVGV